MTRDESIKLAVKFLKAHDLTKTEIKDYRYLESLIDNFIEYIGVELTDPMICDVIDEFRVES
jgi:hypothetical protein